MAWLQARFATGDYLSRLLECCESPTVRIDAWELGMKIKSNGIFEHSPFEIHLPRRSFQFYGCLKFVDFTVNKENLKSSLCTVESGNACFIQWESTQKYILRVRLEHEGGMDHQEFVVPLEKDSWCLEYGFDINPRVNAQCELPSMTFLKSLKRLKNFGNRISISVAKKWMRIYVEGSSASSVWSIHDDNLSIRANEHADGVFSVEKMTKYCKATSISPLIRVTLLNDATVTIEYPIEGNGVIRFRSTLH